MSHYAVFSFSCLAYGYDGAKMALLNGHGVFVEHYEDIPRVLLAVSMLNNTFLCSTVSCPEFLHIRRCHEHSFITFPTSSTWYNIKLCIC